MFSLGGFTLGYFRQEARVVRVSDSEDGQGSAPVEQPVQDVRADRQAQYSQDRVLHLPVHLLPL